jgi:hypothetical protein
MRSVYPSMYLCIQFLSDGPTYSCSWTILAVGTCSREFIVKQQVLHSRRQHERVDTPQGVWAVWRCGLTEDTSRVKDLSVRGLFIETLKVCPVDANVDLYFLVEDGEIRANATVRYVKPGCGLGLQFKTIRTEDRIRFTTMIKRLLRPR